MGHPPFLDIPGHLEITVTTNTATPGLQASMNNLCAVGCDPSVTPALFVLNDELPNLLIYLVPTV